MFQHLFKVRPVSINSSPRKKREYTRNIKNKLVDVVEQPIFAADTSLKATVYYFNHDNDARTRDVHNILKPLFDNLIGIVYHDDKQIVIFKALRLDMLDLGEKFNIENSTLSDDDLEYIIDGGEFGADTSLLIEVQPTVKQVESGIEIVWLPELVDDNYEL